MKKTFFILVVMLIAPHIFAKSLIVHNFEFSGIGNYSRTITTGMKQYESVYMNGGLAYSDGQNTYSCSFEHEFESNSEIFQSVIDGGQLCLLNSTTSSQVLKVTVVFDNYTVDPLQVKFTFNIYADKGLLYSESVFKPRDLEALWNLRLRKEK